VDVSGQTHDPAILLPEKIFEWQAEWTQAGVDVWWRAKFVAPAGFDCSTLEKHTSDGLEGTLVAANRGQWWTVVSWLTNPEDAQFVGQFARC